MIWNLPITILLYFMKGTAVLKAVSEGDHNKVYYLEKKTILDFWVWKRLGFSEYLSPIMNILAIIYGGIIMIIIFLAIDLYFGYKDCKKYLTC
jgi:uncharacterized membrane protein YqgA involved in biofilm formation